MMRHFLNATVEGTKQIRGAPLRSIGACSVIDEVQSLKPVTTQD